MKTTLKYVLLSVAVIILSSCRSVRVSSDYDERANFENFKTFAFLRSGIDKAEISDLDKRRILRAIESEMLSKGFQKSENPDVLISFFTKSKEHVNIYNNSWNYGFWGGFWPGFGIGWNQPNVTTSTQGYLYIDILDASTKELIWQGVGTGYLAQHRDAKEERIKDFVSEMLKAYPPQKQLTSKK